MKNKEAINSNKKLEESEEFLKLIINSFNDGILVTDRKTKKFTFANLKFCEITGYSKEELFRLDINSIHPIKDLPYVLEQFEKQTKRVINLANNIPILKKNKEIIYCDINSNILKIKDRDLIIGIFRDITEKKKNEEIVKKNKELLFEMTNKIPGVVYQFYTRPNKEMGFYYVSNKSEEILGLKPDLKGYFERFTALVIPEHRKSFIKSIEKSVKESSKWEYEGILQKPTGEKIWFSGNSSPMLCEKEIVFNGIVTDITERKESEKKLKDNYKFLIQVIDSLNYPFYVIDANDFTIKLANSTTGITDLSKKPKCYEISYHSKQPCIKPDNICPLEIIKKTKKPFIVEHIHYDKENKQRSVEIHSIPIIDDKGDINRFVEYSIDITDIKHAKEKLKESEEKYRTIIENAEDQIFVLDKNYRYISANQKVASLLRTSQEKLIGMPITDFFPKEISTQFIKNIQEVFDTAKIKSIEEKIIIQDKEFYNSTILNPIKDSIGNVISVMGIVRDITQQKEAEKELIKRTNDLEKFNSFAVDRELKMIDLKKEINSLLLKLNEKPKYHITNENK
jgi:PAS domain S-box-containing protein